MNSFEVCLKHKLDTLEELSLLYTPGVGFSSKEIARDKALVNSLTNRKNSVAVICDCNKCPESYLPYAQAVCNILKKTSGLDAYPFVSKSYDINKIIENLEPSFAGFFVFTNSNIKVFSSPVFHLEIEDFDFDRIVDGGKFILDALNKIDTPSFVADENAFRTSALQLRQTLKGVIEVENTFKNVSLLDLKDICSKDKLDSISAQICKNPELAQEVTCKKNTIAIISDGSAVLGLGNIGAEAGLPVMEGKSAIFKALGDVNAIPICLKTQDIKEFIDITTAISYSFGGINLEDINAPRCFEIEENLIEKTNIPIFHDDQHGTAIIVLAAILGALKLADKNIQSAKIVMSGAGAAAQAVAKLLLKAGAYNLILCDKDGVISNTSVHTDKYLKKMAQITNPNQENGVLSDVLRDADVLIGLSAAGIVSQEMIKSMNEKAIVCVLANPIPEIMPDLAKEAGAFIVATGRSDFENQINNSLAFPGIFKGVLQKGIKKITDDIKYNAALAIARYASIELKENKILPQALDRGIVDCIVSSL